MVGVYWRTICFSSIILRILIRRPYFLILIKPEHCLNHIPKIHSQESYRSIFQDIRLIWRPSANWPTNTIFGLLKMHVTLPEAILRIVPVTGKIVASFNVVTIGL